MRPAWRAAAAPDFQPFHFRGLGPGNLYVAVGVNITDAGYSALRVYSGEYGPVGTGITSRLLGSEHQDRRIRAAIRQGHRRCRANCYQSGTDRYHGALTGFFQPKGFQHTLQPDDFNLSNTYGKALHKEGYDVAGEFGGPVPGVRKHLFFYGSFDPTWNRIYSLAPTASALSAWAL